MKGNGKEWFGSLGMTYIRSFVLVLVLEYIPQHINTCIWFDSNARLHAKIVDVFY